MQADGVEVALLVKVFHEPQGLLYHGGAVAYAVLADGFGLAPGEGCS